MRLDWRRYTVYLALMGVEACALYALLALLNRQVAAGRLSVYQFLLAYGLAFVLNRVVPRRWPKLLSIPLNVIAWAAVTLLMVKIQLYGNASFADPAWLLAVPRAIGVMLYGFEPPLLLLLSSALSWFLGWHLGRSRPTFGLAIAIFQFGLAAILAVFFAAAELGAPLDYAVPLTMLFFVFALAGMSLAHAGEDGGWLSAMRQGHWPVMLMAAIGLILVLGLAVSLVITPGLLQLLLSAAAWVWDQVVKGLMFLVSLLPEPGPMEPIPGMNETAGEPKEGGIQLGIPEPWLSGLRIGWNILFIGLIVIALWRISSQVLGWLRRKMGGTGGEAEPMPGAFRADILGFLKRVILRLFGLRPKARPARAEPTEIASVRHVYRQVLKWATGYGWRRPAFQTPDEYLPTLEKLLPDCAEDFRFITRQYVSARYGFATPGEADLARLKQSWRQINGHRLTRSEAKGASHS